MWHASVCPHDASGPVPWERCGLKARALLREMVFSLLAGVGTGNTRRDRSPFVLHARRKLNAGELALLSPEWCAIEPVDIAGGGIPW